MKQSHDQILSSSDEKTEKITSQVIITLDETIRSNLLYHKFKFQTTELQLFLQYVPVLYWYPFKLLGTSNFKYHIDSCIFSAALRNPLHQHGTIDMIQGMLNQLDNRWNDKKILDRIHCLKMDHERLDKRKVSSLLKSLLDDKLFIPHVNNVFSHISDLLIADEEEFYLIVERQITELSAVKVAELKSDLEQVKENGLALRNVTDGFKDNEEVVFEAIKQNGLALRYASNRLKDNEEIVLEAIKQNSNALYFASKRLQDNEQFILQVFKENYLALRYASFRLQDNEQFLLEAIKQNAKALKYTSDRLQDNEEIVLEAVKQNGTVLEFASNRLQDNELIVFEAFKQNVKSLQFASARLRNDLNFSYQIFKCCNTLEVFQYLAEELRSIEFICYFIENYQSYFHELVWKPRKEDTFNRAPPNSILMSQFR